MAKAFHLTIARIGENVFDDEAVSLTLPGSEGMMTVLADHEPFISELAVGEARFEAADGKHYHIPVREGGVIEISHNQATVLL
ncbi:MAG TPA: hypothetical protein VF829_01775 [Candidatus Paceibacterota bacterium]